MTENLDRIRLQAIRSYNSLTKTLKSKKNFPYETIVVEVRDIAEDMEILRQALVIIGCAYSETDTGLGDISEEVGILEVFNPEE